MRKDATEIAQPARERKPRRRKKRRGFVQLGVICTISHIAESLGISEATIRNLVNEGCPHLDGGQGKYLFNSTAFAEFMASRTT